MRKKNKSSRIEIARNNGTAGRHDSALESLESRTLFSVYFVDASGAIGGNGLDLQHPFTTIAQASAVVQPGDTVEIRGGTYHETITPPTDGTLNDPITYEPYNNEMVTISAADPIDSSATWSLDGPTGHIYKTSITMNLGDQNSVYVNGKQMVEARWPNLPLTSSGDANLLDLTKYATVNMLHHTGAGTVLTPSSAAGLAAGGSLAGAQLSILGGSKYAIQTATLVGNVGAGGAVTYKNLFNYSFLVPQAGSRYYISGARVLLDAPGEWFYDANSQQLYIYMPNGQSPAGQDIEVRTRTDAVDLTGRSNIDITGFNILGGAIVTDQNSHSNTIDSIVSTYGGKNSTVNPGMFGNSFDAPQAVFLNGSDNTLENSTVSYVSGNGVGIQGSDNRAINNIIHDADLGGTYAAGISIAGNRYVVENNSIFNTARDGMHVTAFPLLVSTGSGEEPEPSQDGRIAYNNIYDYGYIAHDLGAIALNADLDGSGTSIDHNWLHDNMTDNSVGFRGAGVYLDNGSGRFVVSHNVMWNNGDAGVWINVSEGQVKNFLGNNYGNIITNNTIPLMGQRRGIVINGARVPNHTNDVFDTRIENNLSEYFPSSDTFLPGHAPMVDHNLTTFNFPANFRSASGLNKGVNLPGLMDDPTRHDAGAYESGQTWVPGAMATHLTSTYVAPGATTDGTVLVVDNLDDLAKTFFAQGIVIDNSRKLEGSDTGAAKRTSGNTIIYRYNGITDFALKFFGPPGSMQIFGSSDNVNYTAIATTVSAGIKGQAATRTLNNAHAITANTNFLKIVLGTAATELAQAEIRYHDSDLAENHDADSHTFTFTTAGERAQAAIDANPSSRYESQDTATDQNPFLSVDLTANHSINLIRANFFPENGQIPDNYSIETSTDDINYTTATTVTNGNGATVVSNNGSEVYVDINLPTTTARFVRFVPSTPGIFSIWSFEVYGT